MLLGCVSSVYLGLENVGELLYKQGVSMHDFINSVNERALEKTYDYYKRFRAFHLDRSKLPRDTEARAVMIDRVSISKNTQFSICSLRFDMHQLL